MQQLEIFIHQKWIEIQTIMEKDFKLQINSIDDFQNNELSPHANRNLGPVYVLWAT